MRTHKAITLTLLVMCLGIAMSLNLTRREKPQTIAPLTIQQTDLASDLGEQYELRQASLAYSRYVSASASTTTPAIVPPRIRTALHYHSSRKSPHRSIVAPSRVTESKSENPPGDIWGKLAACESGGNTRATSSNGLYLGAFQFSITTWHSVGGPGDPRDSDYGTQLSYAQKLQARSGWGQWPRCSSKLGLR